MPLFADSLPVWPAVWSAIAASFSALSSLLIFLIHRRNLQEAVRSELVLLGWDRQTRGEGEGRHDIVTIKTLRNVGRGNAFHVVVNAHKNENNFPLYGMSTTRFPIVAVNETIDLNGQILIWWKNVKADRDGDKVLLVNVSIGFSDSRGLRHETQYDLFVMDRPQMVGDIVAPGLMMGMRNTTTIPIWWNRLRARPFNVLEFVKSLLGRIDTSQVPLRITEELEKRGWWQIAEDNARKPNASSAPPAAPPPSH